MFSAANLPDVIPVFPLPGAVLLPRAHLPLQVFEPRYLAMVEDVLKTKDRLIGMVQPYGTQGEKLHDIGCAGRITAFSETDDGRYMITLTGVSRYRITSEIDGFTAYRRANATWSAFDRDLGPAEEDTSFDKPRFMDLLGRYFADRGLSTDWESLKDAETELLINSLSMLCPFESEEKQALLEAPSLTDRRETLVTLITYALRGGGTEEIMQ